MQIKHISPPIPGYGYKVWVENPSFPDIDFLNSIAMWGGATGYEGDCTIWELGEWAANKLQEHYPNFFKEAFGGGRG